MRYRSPGSKDLPFMTGTCWYAGETVIGLSASVGSVEIDGDGGWTWQLTPDDGPTERGR
jgi:hypothetical protein